MTIQLVLAFVGIIYFIVSQENKKRQRVMANFIVTNACINGSDQSALYLTNKTYFSFYKTGGEPISLCGVMNDAGQQIYGHVSYIAAKRLKQTSSKEQTDTQSFTWTYEDINNGSKNTAQVTLVKNYTNTKVEFDLLIETLDHNRLKFKGYMGNTLQALK